MNSQSQPDSPQNRLNALVIRSATDAAFRAKLIASPRETLSELLGSSIDPASTIAVVDSQTDDTFVLPPVVAPGVELPERELEAVSGGTDPAGLAIAGAVATILTSIASVFSAINSYETNHPVQVPELPPDEPNMCYPGGPY
jgi:lactobin A/cerein 7B family class IIb bacteriocin